MLSERFYRWLGWSLSGIAVILMFTNYAGAVVPVGCAITGFACAIMARVIRLELKFDALITSNRLTLAALADQAQRLESAVRDEQVP